MRNLNVYLVSLAMIFIASCKNESPVLSGNYRPGYLIKRPQVKETAITTQKSGQQKMVTMETGSKELLLAQSDESQLYIREKMSVNPLAKHDLLASINNIVISNQRAAIQNSSASATENQLSKQKLSEKFSKAINSIKNTPEYFKTDMPQWLLIVLCVILPPLAVGLTYDISSEFWISLLLTLLFWIPGVIYALIVCLR